MFDSLENFADSVLETAGDTIASGLPRIVDYELNEQYGITDATDRQEKPAGFGEAMPIQQGTVDKYWAEKETAKDILNNKMFWVAAGLAAYLVLK